MAIQGKYQKGKCRKWKGWYVVDDSHKLEHTRPIKTRKEAEQYKAELIASRSKRSERSNNREFGRSLNLNVKKLEWEC